MNLGIAIQLPKNVGGFVLPRSGLASKNLVAPINAPGLIDPGYTGELMVPLMNYSDEVYTVSQNESCLLYTSPSPRDATLSRMPSSA